MSIFLNLLYIVLGSAGLYYGAEFLVKGGVTLARKGGVSPLVIGLTLVAFATSAPELVVSVDAALAGEGGISIGNVVGSNIFNILGILGVAPILAPIHAPGISNTDMIFMLFLSLALVPIMKTGFKIDRREGLFLLGIYAVYVLWLILA